MIEFIVGAAIFGVVVWLIFDKNGRDKVIGKITGGTKDPLDKDKA